MQISPVSNLNAVSGGAQAAPSAKSSAPTAPEDTVHLSKAAQAAIAGGDADHDGDSH
jgi:hypothetical protein